MNKDSIYKSGEQITQKLFEMTGDPRYHNMRVGFEQLSREKQMEESQENEREM